MALCEISDASDGRRGGDSTLTFFSERGSSHAPPRAEWNARSVSERETTLSGSTVWPAASLHDGGHSDELWLVAEQYVSWFFSEMGRAASPTETISWPVPWLAR